ncbi:hypothetical protein HPB47_014145 [Ixodes persulcatus]|uniref:Uncharacterized protein n=1 Tax=Ixodes persulcatus TaxID=34615 RepID=A0AC60QX09_IXOPE|nr:hypothetical protein HPB47_014145 [Ixodes persulcatus]
MNTVTKKTSLGSRKEDDEHARLFVRAFVHHVDINSEAENSNSYIDSTEAVPCFQNEYRNDLNGNPSRHRNPVDIWVRPIVITSVKVPRESTKPITSTVAFTIAKVIDIA